MITALTSSTNLLLFVTAADDGDVDRRGVTIGVEISRLSCVSNCAGLAATGQEPTMHLVIVLSCAIAVTVIGTVLWARARRPDARTLRDATSSRESVDADTVALGIADEHGR